MYSLIKTLVLFVSKLQNFLGKLLIWSVPSILNVKYLGLSFKVDSSFKDGLINELANPNTKWENEELRTFINLVSEAKVIFDIGSNQGVYSIVAAKVNPQAMIFAFEPYATNSQKIKKNLQLNSIVNNVQVNEIALGNQDGTILFNVPINSNATSSVTSVNEAFTNEWHKEIKAIQVPLRKLDSWVEENNITKVDLIKLDVEYFEGQVLEGAKKIISKHKPTVLCEVLIYEVLVQEFPSMNGKLDPAHSYFIETFFRDLGYCFYSLGKDGIMRVDNLHNHPDSRNFLFSTYFSKNIFIAYDDKSAFIKLMEHE